MLLIAIFWCSKVLEMQNDYLNYMIEISENGIERLNYSYEESFREAIRNGNIELLSIRRFADQIYDGNVGIVARDNFKQLEYMTVSSITIATRELIDAGINPLLAYSLSDIYLQKLEKCKTKEEILTLQEKAMIDFSKHIQKKAKEKRSFDYIEKCKAYIIQHINKKICITDIAKEIPINASYLSRRFSEEEGMTIQQYIIKEKLNAASNMLKYSDYDISTIANYLGFSSQSNMGRMFKKVYGLSPNEYRKKNQVRDFM